MKGVAVMILVQLGMRCVLSTLTLSIAPRQLMQQCNASHLRHFFRAQAPVKVTLRALERLLSSQTLDFQSYWVTSHPSEDFLTTILEVSMGGNARGMNVETISTAKEYPDLHWQAIKPISADPHDSICLQRLLPITLIQHTTELAQWALNHWDVLQSIIIVGVNQLKLSIFPLQDQERILATIVNDPVRHQVTSSICYDRYADQIWTVGSIWRLFDGPCIYQRIKNHSPVSKALEHIKKLAREGNLLAKIRLATIHRFAFPKPQWALLSAMCVNEEKGGGEIGAPCGDQLGFALQSFADISDSAILQRTPDILKTILHGLHSYKEIEERDRIAFSFELLSAALIFNIGRPNKPRKWAERMISSFLTKWPPSQVSPYSARCLLAALYGVIPTAGFPPVWEEVRRAFPPTDHFPLNLLPWSTRLALWRHQVVHLTDPGADGGPEEYPYRFFANLREYNEAVLERTAHSTVARETGDYVSFRCTLSQTEGLSELTLLQFRDDLELYWQGRLQLVALTEASPPRLHLDLRRALLIKWTCHQDIWELRRMIGKSCWPDAPSDMSVIDTLYETLRDTFYWYNLNLLYDGVNDVANSRIDHPDDSEHEPAY